MKQTINVISGHDYEIYGGIHSLFTLKMVAGAELLGLNYKYIDKNLEIKEYIETRAETHQIPVVKFVKENWVINDTTPIFHLLDSKQISLHNKLYPIEDDFTYNVVNIIEEYLDEIFCPKIAISSRWSYDKESALKVAKEMGIAQSSSSPNEDVIESIAQGMYKWGSKKATRAIGMASKQQIESEKENCKKFLDLLQNHLKNRKFVLGDAPCAIDCIILGLLNAHIFLDDAPKKEFPKSKYNYLYEWADHLAYESAKEWILSEFDDNKILTREILDPNNLPELFKYLFNEIKIKYVPFIIENRNAIKNKKKSFISKFNNEDVSFLTRTYPIASLIMTKNNLKLNNKKFKKLSKEYNLDKILYSNILSNL